MAAIQIGDTVDGMMLSYLIGEDAMCSVNICRPVVKGILAVCTLLGAGGSMMAGVAIGNHNREEANHVFTDTVLAAVAIGVALLLVGLAWLVPLTELLCPEEQLRQLTSEYLSVTLNGSSLCILSGLLAMLVAVDGSPRHVTVAVLASALSNVAFDFLFIAVMGKGVFGAALATLLSYVVSLLILLPHFFRKEAMRLMFTHCFATLHIHRLAAGLGLYAYSRADMGQQQHRDDKPWASRHCGSVGMSVHAVPVRHHYQRSHESFPACGLHIEGLWRQPGRGLCHTEGLQLLGCEPRCVRHAYGLVSRCDSLNVWRRRFGCLRDNEGSRHSLRRQHLHALYGLSAHNHLSALRQQEHSDIHIYQQVGDAYAGLIPYG